MSELLLHLACLEMMKQVSVRVGGVLPFDDNSSPGWKIMTLQEYLVQVIFIKLGWCLVKLLFAGSILLYAKKVCSVVRWGTLRGASTCKYKLPPHKIEWFTVVLNQPRWFIQRNTELPSEKMWLQKIVWWIKNTNLTERNGMLDCLGNEANFHTCFLFSFFLSVLFLCLEPVGVFNVWLILTIVPMLLGKIFQQVWMKMKKTEQHNNARTFKETMNTWICFDTMNDLI